MKRRGLCLFLSDLSRNLLSVGVLTEVLGQRVRQLPYSHLCLQVAYHAAR